MMIIKDILPALANPQHAYHSEHLYVLSSLATFKSIVLLTDIPSSEVLIAHLFSTFFDVVSGSGQAASGETVSQNVEADMTTILVIMVDEAPSLPLEVIDMIVAQFLRLDPRVTGVLSGKSQKNGVMEERQSTLELKAFPTAYNVARNICNTCPDKMAQHVVQYFSDVIVDASDSKAAAVSKKRKSDEGPDGFSQHSEDDLKELQKAHLLLRELWRACPAVLQNVIPQLEAELSMENVHLRLLATETFADMISGIGSPGLPMRIPIDPAAYPPTMLSSPPVPVSTNPVTKPSSPQSFSSTHSSAYNGFLSRRNDKSPLIRCACAKGIGNIIRTSAGGTGLSTSEVERLVADFSRMMCDADEKVRLAAVKAVSSFTLHDIVDKLGSSGGVNDERSFLATLADRARDKKHAVRSEAMKTLGCWWAAALGEIMNGNASISILLGAIPSKILGGYYANDQDIDLAIDNALYEQFLPLSYPPVKSKTGRTHGVTATVEDENENQDPDYLRAVRILLLVNGLDDKAEAVFFRFIQRRQVSLSKYVETYIQRCEDYNGGIIEGDEKAIKQRLADLITGIAKHFPEPGNVAAHLWRLAKMHDRRCYKLIQYCMASESDYKTVKGAINEFKRRIESQVSGSKDMLETLLPLLYRVSIIIYNKSHIPAIMHISKTNFHGLGEIAHRVLLEISTNNPTVLKAQVKEICKNLQDSAPSSHTSSPSPSTIVGDLKACSSFAAKFADEIPKDQKFVQAMRNFAMHGSPPECAKHAVSILMSSAKRRELIAHDLTRECIKSYKYGAPGFLARLATLSQLILLAPDQVADQENTILNIANEQILKASHSPPLNIAMESYIYTLPMNDECAAKCWALKILGNRVRAHNDPETLEEATRDSYRALHQVIINDGALEAPDPTPGKHRPHLRLMAARLLLKCSTKKYQDLLLTPEHFNALALVAQDEALEVRSRFLTRLRKYLTQGKLPQRFYTIPFLLAFEPNEVLRAETTTWLRSRAAYFSSGNFRRSSNGKAAIVLESILARLLSLLAHHPDFRNTPEDLVDMSRYIAFYLSTVANSENLSLIYHIAQRVKQSQDALSDSHNDDTLYILSDLAQLTIRRFEDLQGFIINTLPTKIKLPTSLYRDITDHEEAQAIADRSYLPDGDDDIEDRVERVVRETMRKPSDKRGSKKRKSEGEGGGAATAVKKAKTGTLPVRSITRKANGSAKNSKTVKTPKSSNKKPSIHTNGDLPSSEHRRRSGRVGTTGEKSYAEDDDDDEVDDDEIIWRYEDKNGEPLQQGQAVAGGADNDDDDDDDDEAGEESSELSEEEPEPEPEPEPVAPLPNGKHKNNANIDKDEMDVDDGGEEDLENADDDADASTNQLNSEASSPTAAAHEKSGFDDLPSSPSPALSSPSTARRTKKKRQREEEGKGKGKVGTLSRANAVGVGVGAGGGKVKKKTTTSSPPPPRKKTAAAAAAAATITTATTTRTTRAARK